MSKFNVGDKVQVVKKISIQGWVEQMDSFVGTTFTIAKIEALDHGIMWYLDTNDQWWFPEDSLELVQDSKILVPTYLVIKSKADCYQALLDGYTLVNETMWAKLVDGDLVTDIDADYTFCNPTEWSVFEEIDNKWFYNIPESGIICWVSDYDTSDKLNVEIITKYDDDSVYSFKGKNESWKYADPLTPDELTTFLQSAKVINK